MRISERTVKELANVANLELSKKRAKLLAPMLRDFLSDLERLDKLDLGEEPLRWALRVRKGKASNETRARAP